MHSITTWTRLEGVGGRKMSVFVHTQSIKTVHAGGGGGGGGSKMAKFSPRSCSNSIQSVWQCSILRTLTTSNIDETFSLNCIALLYLFCFLPINTRVRNKESKVRKSIIKGSPTYAVFTTADPTTAVFGLCTLRWGIFALLGDPRQSH